MEIVLREDDTGVSEVVGTILILAMTVVLFASIILWVGSIPAPTTEMRVDLRPSMSPLYDGSGNEIGVNITVLHRGVERLVPAATVIYVTSQRGTGPLTTTKVLLQKFNPSLPGNKSGLMDGPDTVWDIGERWAYVNYYLRSSDQISVMVIDSVRNISVWSAQVTAPAGTRPPVFVAKWTDDLSGTAAIDPVQATLGFFLYARVVDPDNDLNRNSVYAQLTIYFGTNSTCANPQKLKDDGVYPDLAAGDDVFSFGSNGCTDPPNPALNWDGSLILLNATDRQGHKTDTRLRLTVVPRTSGGGGGPGSGAWALLTSDVSTTTASPLQTAPNVAFALLPNQTYTFKFWVVFRSASSSNGIRLGLTLPTFTRFSASVTIPYTSDSSSTSGQNWIGYLTSSGDFVMSTLAPAANTDFVAIIEGTVRVSQAGNIQLVYGTETSGTSVTLRQGTVGQLLIAA